MPHKHIRKSGNDDSDFNLAPTARAKPLPTFDARRKPAQKSDTNSDSTLKRKHASSKPAKSDDTPRAFKRLMLAASGQKQRSGLDDGTRKATKKSNAAPSAQAPVDARPQVTGDQEQLRILPGESMSAFSARVNQALPVGGLAHKTKHTDGIKERQTRKEKKMHKMYADWREEDARRKAKTEELQEQVEEAEDEKAAEYGGQDISFPASRKGKRTRYVGEVEEREGDPWAALKAKRDRPKGLHDVVQAPPTIKAIPKEKFKVRGGARVDVANVPNAAGSLRRREELSSARKEVLERYRSIMKGGGT